MNVMLSTMLHHSGGYSELARNTALCLNDLDALAVLRIVDQNVFQAMPIDQFCSPEYIKLEQKIAAQQAKQYKRIPETLIQFAPPFMMQPTPEGIKQNIGITMFETRAPLDWFKCLNHLNHLALHDKFQAALFDGGAEHVVRHNWSPWIENPLDNLMTSVSTPPYILSVGVARVHKNHSKIIDAYRMIKKDFPGLLLVIKAITEDPEYDDYRVKIADDPDIRVIPGPYSTIAMNNLYAHCSAYVSASMCEGLDMPAVKAAMCGKPVVAGWHSGHMSWIPATHPSLVTHQVDLSTFLNVHPRYREPKMFGYDVITAHLAEHMRAALTPGEADDFKIDMTGKFTRKECVKSLDILLKSLA